MARFNAAVMDGALDAKFQNRFNYLLDLLDTAYIVEKKINGTPIKLIMSPEEGFAFYQGGGASGWEYRGGLVIRDDELALLTDILGTVDDAYHFIKFDEHKLYDADTEIYSLLKFYASDNSASPSPIETFRIASKYWEATDTAQTFLGVAIDETIVDAAELYLSAGMSLETPVGSAYIKINSSPLSDAAVINILAINPSENSSGFKIYANASSPKIDVMVDYTNIGQWLSTGLKINGNFVWHAGNDGSGSGLDADKLDTYEASAFVRYATTTQFFNGSGIPIDGALSSTLDFNDAVTPGCYTIGISAGNATNGPLGGAGHYGMLQVFKRTSDQIWQIYLGTNEACELVIRRTTNGGTTWGAWQTK